MTSGALRSQIICQLVACLPAFLLLQLRKCHIPRGWSAIVVCFFSTSFHDLFCPLLPAVSLLWNIFRSLYPKGFKPPASSTNFRTRTQQTQGYSPSDLRFCFIVPTFKYSSNLWVYLGFFISIFYLSLLYVWSTNDTSKHKLSIWSLTFLLCPRFLWLVATVQGKFCVYRCNGVSGSVFTTHCLPYNSISCLIFHEVVGEGSISEWLNRLSSSFMSGSTKGMLNCKIRSLS